MALVNRDHTVKAIKRAKSSVNGNPAYFITMTDGTRMRTVTDSGWAYTITDHMIGKRFRFAVTKSGQISYGNPL